MPGRRDHVTAFAPGRVNLIGEHTDYNDGLALPFAIAAGVTVHARATPGRRIESVAADLGQRDGFELDDVRSAPGWRAYVRGAAAELQRAGVSLRGARLLIGADFPAGGGLASSAALEVAVTLALVALTDAPAPDPMELAAICSRIERDWVGAHTGMLDQLASLCAARSCPANRFPLPGRGAGHPRARRLPPGHARLRRAPFPRRFRLQRAPRRMCAGV